MSDIAQGAEGRQEPERRQYRAEPVRRPVKPGGGLRIYKPGQGYYVRVGTVVGSAILIIAGGAFLFNQVGSFLEPGSRYYQPLQYGIPAAFVVAMAVLLYWVVGLNRSANDFFIATEGEMKKVSWSSRKEVIRSTKVVIVTVVLMAILLFVVDIGFMMFFRAIGVLKSGPALQELFGGSNT